MISTDGRSIAGVPGWRSSTRIRAPDFASRSTTREPMLPRAPVTRRVDMGAISRSGDVPRSRVSVPGAITMAWAGHQRPDHGTIRIDDWFILAHLARLAGFSNVAFTARRDWFASLTGVALVAGCGGGSRRVPVGQRGQ